MNYAFDFSVLTGENLDLLWHGIQITTWLTLVGAVGGGALGIFCAWSRSLGPRWLRPPVVAYIELTRNTPFLIQLFFIFFGLPVLGVKLTGMQASLLAMVVNLGAYSAEIIRAGIEATPRGQFEAGASLAMSRMQVFRHVVLMPALQRIWPALSSQVVIVMLGSAVCSQVAAQDLTYAANLIQARTFRAFEAYFATTLIYLMLAILLRQALRALGWALFARRSPA
ncbi:amino acid ABC transporter permease [Achromobacter sp. GG226]|uniref:amino acid ABC transporter permease n=1 Tax=Verticiella alkaliphila TaxID=2779529 RepID=UPI001C0D6F47|nr:amino acid ABC transporter permease [Verticiella sp. GG226]MBU4609536.1 amino acid ABC transporter permease [Verticiella sp. GG226]